MYKGTVQRLNANPWQGKMLHSFTLNTEKGFFNLGTKAPSFKEGNVIQFEAKPAKRAGAYDVDFNSIAVVTEDSPSPESYSMASGAKRTTLLQKDDYWKNREDRDLEVQKRIEIQAARNAAIATLGTIATSGLDTEEYLVQVDLLTNGYLADNEARLKVVA